MFKSGIAALLIAAVATAAVAPAAEAKHGKSRRYKGYRYERVVSRDHGHRHYYRDRGSSVGPALAGFVGGLALGVILSNTAERGYYYRDPYCHDRFASLDAYYSHCRRHHHPKVVQVINVNTGRCADTYRYDDGRWVDEDYYEEAAYRGDYGCGHEGCGWSCDEDD
jgi:hypothetical protein